MRLLWRSGKPSDCKGDDLKFDSQSGELFFSDSGNKKGEILTSATQYTMFCKLGGNAGV